ncbi:hypothetical protein [Methanofollis liminatans]|nr:hypothetical protein [Methanofollis liminatans]
MTDQSAQRGKETIAIGRRMKMNGCGRVPVYSRAAYEAICKESPLEGAAIAVMERRGMIIIREREAQKCE